MEQTEWIPFEDESYTLIRPVDVADMQYNPATGNHTPSAASYSKEGGNIFALAENPEDLGESVKAATRHFEDMGVRIGPEHLMTTLDHRILEAVQNDGSAVQLQLQRDAKRPWRIRIVGL